jgi:uncharacterized protein DUF2442
VQEVNQVKRYKIQYPISAYTFPLEIRIHQVRFDDKYMHVDLTDGRIVSIPLWWIPTVHNAAPEEREKFEISRDHTMIIWDPDKSAINDEIRVADYMGPSNEGNQVAEDQTLTHHRAIGPRHLAEAKARHKKR